MIARARHALEFATRPQRRTVMAAFRYRRYVDRGGRYAVERSACIFNRGLDNGRRLPVVWRALVRVEAGWEIVSQHRTRRAAERACRRHAREAIA